MSQTNQKPKSKLDKIMFHYNIRAKDLSARIKEQNRIGIESSQLSRMKKNPERCNVRTIIRICKALSALITEQKKTAYKITPNDIINYED